MGAFLIMKKNSDKIIRDSIHGYISIPNVYIENIIDTPVFQRLRRIEQTSMRCLYPSARHDRFTHSLGVYHLGCKAYDGLYKNVKLFQKYYNADDDMFWHKYRTLFSLACLLHDCAHSPYSHTLEYAYLDSSDTEQITEMKNRLVNSMIKLNAEGVQFSHDNEFFKEITNKDINAYFAPAQNGDYKISPHELASALLVSEYFSTGIVDILEALYAIDVRDDYNIIIEDIQFIQRSIIGRKYTLPESSSLDNDEYRRLCYKNCFISLLNSASFDVDKLDYLIRDSRESGVDNISIDYERLLNALLLVESHQYKESTKIEGVINNSIMIEEYAGRVSESSSDTNELVINLKNVHIDGKITGYIEINEGGISSENGAQLPNGYKDIVDGDYYGRIGSGIIRGHYVGELTADATPKNPSFMRGSMSCSISGSIKGAIIGEIELNDNGQVILELAYDKNAISILEDTLTARNRLYLWIYAHHKVVYADYSLRNALLYSLIPYDGSNNILYLKEQANQVLRDIINVDAFFDSKKSNYLVDDGDFTHIIKKSLMEPEKFYIEYQEEWIARNNKFSIWKSFAEFNLLFSALTNTQIIYLWNALFDTSSNIENLEMNKTSEGSTSEYKKSCLVETFPSADFVWIKPSGTKIASIDSENTYVVINNKVTRFKDVLIKTKTAEEYAHEHFFYLYVRQKLSSEQKGQLVSYLKSVAQKVK